MIPNDFDVEGLTKSIRARGLPFGLPMSWVAETGSTNADAVAAANAGAPHGALFVADHQTQGRGRMGRTWISPPGQNLYASIVLRPSLEVERLPCITLAIGLAVADAVAELVDSAVVGIKWPNDVLVNQRKVAGILVEGALSGDRCEFIVIGLGLNVHQRVFDPTIASRATSLANETERIPARHDLLLSVLQHMASKLMSFEHGGLQALMDELNARDVTKGRNVRVGDACGVADGIEPDGRLRVVLDGKVERLHAGDVEILEG